MNTSYPLVTEPLYQQLNTALRHIMQREAFKPGDQFLTERQVSERFNVSRVTANKALASLVAEGKLDFRKGVGTFVREEFLDYDLRSLVSFTDKVRAAGKTPSTRLLRYEMMAAGSSGMDLNHMRLAPEDLVHLVVRVRFADEIPVILERRLIAARRCPNLTTADLEGSLYSAFTEKFLLDIEGADETIRAVSLSGDDARLLAVPEGAAGFAVLAVGHLSGGEPLWSEDTLYRGDAYEFRNRIGPIRSLRPVAGSLIASSSVLNANRT